MVDPIGALGIGLAMTIDRSEPIKVAFNSTAYALAAGLAALPLLIDGGGRTLTDSSRCRSWCQALSSLRKCDDLSAARLDSDCNRVREVFGDDMLQSGPIFAISVFVAAQAVTLRLSAPLVLVERTALRVDVYQRSLFAAESPRRPLDRQPDRPPESPRLRGRSGTGA